MGTQTVPLQHHLLAPKFRHFQEIRRGNNKPQGKTGLIPLLSSSSNPSGGATSDQLDAMPVAGCPQRPPWQNCPRRWAKGLSCSPPPQLLRQPAMGQLFHRAAESNHHPSDSSGGVSRLLDSLSVTVDRKKSPVIQKWIPAGPPGNS